MCSKSKRKGPGTRSKLTPTGEMCYGGGYASLNKWLFSWLRKPIIVYCDRTGHGSLFHSVVETIAKTRLPMAFLGQTEERAN